MARVRTPQSGSDDVDSSRGDNVDPLVGDRLRRARRLRGLTLTEVATEVGLSHNFLSMVERGVTDISLARFRRLAAFYALPAGELLEEVPANAPHISSPEDGMKIDRGEGITYRVLPHSEFGVQVIYASLDPGTRFEDALSHVGADIVWIISGSLTLHYGEHVYPLRAGTCVSYKGNVPHRFENHSSSKAAELVAVVTSPYW